MCLDLRMTRRRRLLMRVSRLLVRSSLLVRMMRLPVVRGLEPQPEDMVVAFTLCLQWWRFQALKLRALKVERILLL